jgi:hypothetical protein
MFAIVFLNMRHLYEKVPMISTMYEMYAFWEGNNLLFVNYVSNVALATP